jgi:hypothetical protein
MEAIAQRKKRVISSGTADLRRLLAEQRSIGYVPFHQSLSVFPELGVILEAKSYPIRNEVRAGWVAVKMDGVLQKIAFRFMGHWNREMLLAFQHQKLAAQIMLSVHRGLMQAKFKDRSVKHFHINGLFFDRQSGLNTDFVAY